MTRVLSELLGAPEPHFSRSLRQLESMSGHPRTDIRLSSGLQQSVQAKLLELQLDKHDTTGEELYVSLGQRLARDEAQFVRALEALSGKGEDVLVQLARSLSQAIQPTTTYALKATTAKKLLRANLPRKTMKLLGYRSADSMFKHESAASLYAAAALTESAQWSKKMLAAYSKLSPTDFEQRAISIEHPSSKRWQQFSDTAVARHKHFVLSFKELGAVVLLPLPAEKPALSTLLTAVLTLHAVNEIRAAGTYMKLHQLRGQFGSVVQQVVQTELQLQIDSLGQSISWHSLQQYFSRFGSTLRSDLFEPLVTVQELVWTPIEPVLSHIEPSLAFWHNTAHLGLQGNGRPISLNLTDALLSHANGLDYPHRVIRHFRQTLQSELLLSYLSHENLEQSMFNYLQHNLAPEMAEA